MQSIRAWFAAHPGRIDEILQQNRSYIFFREAPVDDPALGPVAAAKVPLTPGRSVAVDRLLHTFGTPFFIDAPSLKAFEGKAFRRLMIAQDTGSAIIGPARGDLFAGSGDAAGEIAGVVNHRPISTRCCRNRWPVRHEPASLQEAQRRGPGALDPGRALRCSAQGPQGDRYPRDAGATEARAAGREAGGSIEGSVARRRETGGRAAQTRPKTCHRPADARQAGEGRACRSRAASTCTA